MYRVPLACAVAVLAALAASVAATECDPITLAGTWTVALDPEDLGPSVFAGGHGDDSLRGEVWLPGSIQQQGLGFKPTAGTGWTGSIRESEWSHAVYDPYRDDETFKAPFWLQPERVYIGAAWYERVVEVPVAWAGQRVSLSLERAHWVTTVWWDDAESGTRDSLSVPHLFDLGDAVPGRHTLRIRVDNRMAQQVGDNAHSVSDHTQGNWNGLIGRIELRPEPQVRISGIRVTPSAAGRSAVVTVKIENRLAAPENAWLSVRASTELGDAAALSVGMNVPAGAEVSQRIDLDLGDEAALWDEFSPNVYQLEATLTSAAGKQTRTTSFGLRDFATDGTRFTLNGRPIYLRGTLDCCIYPLTGYPPMDVPGWERVFGRVKEFGLNHVRFHSWCPPRAAFVAADRLGVYLQVEGPFWVNGGPRLGLGDPIDRFVYTEIDRILDEYGNHPSFMLMAYGNEPAGPQQGGLFLGPWLEHVKARDPRRLFTSAAGWPVLDENQFHNIPAPRLQQWGQGLDSSINGEPPRTDRDHRGVIERHDVPIISHEIGQWCAFPNFEEMKKYTGHLKPKNFEIFQELLARNGLAHRERSFLMASGALQLLCYKQEIETCLRTPGHGGFQLLDLHDFPGQGTALVGVLDPFWDPKPYVSAQQFLAFCAPTVPLARLSSRVFAAGEVLRAGIEVSHFGPADLGDALVDWKLDDVSSGRLASGQFGPMTLATGRLSRVGAIEFPVEVSEPTRALLRVSVEGTGGANAWSIWLYPRSVDTDIPSGVHLARKLDQEAEEALAAGRTVLLLAKPDTVLGGVTLGFSSTFWNYAWTGGQAPHTLGILVDPAHPVFKHFPTGSHTDWQWWEPIARAGAMVIDDLPGDLLPLVQPIDTWFRSRRLATLFEARVGPGKLVVCTMDLESDLERRLAARQLRHSLMSYIASPDFNPAVAVAAAAIRAIFREPSAMERLGASIDEATSHEPGYEPRLAIDGDPATMWHTNWSAGTVPHPHQITIRLAAPTEISGLACTARQSEENGKVARYEIRVSSDGQRYGEPVAVGAFTTSTAEQIVRFDSPRKVRCVRLICQSSLNGGEHTSIAELRLLTR